MRKTFIPLGKKKLHRPSKRELLRAADDIKLYRCDRFTIAVLKNLVQKTRGDQFTGCFSVQRMAKSWGISTRGHLGRGHRIRQGDRHRAFRRP